MSKPMTVNEAVEVARDVLSERQFEYNGVRLVEIVEALAVLEGVRLVDEAEARGVLIDLIRQHAKIASDPNYLGMFQLAQVHGMSYRGPQFDLSAARRWLAEHGGE